MRSDGIARKAGLFAASSLIALALATLPVTPGQDAAPLAVKAAQAKGNGNGNGGGNANGHGKGADGSAASLDAHGKATGGHAKGKGNGHSLGLSLDGQELDAETYGLTASAMKGLNASHASIQGFAHASDNSMVGAIRSAVLEAYEDEDKDSDGLIDADDMPAVNEIDDDMFEDQLEAIRGGVDLDADVVDAVKGLVDDKVEVPE